MQRLLVAGLVATMVIAACGSEPQPLAEEPSVPAATATPLLVEQPTDTPAPEEPSDAEATPTEEPTAEEPTAETEPAALAVKVTKLTKTVQAGGKASATIATAKGATCSIIVEYSSGPSTANGLGDKTTDSAGTATWTWTVGSNTHPGTYVITIDCASGNSVGLVSTEFVVR